MVVWGALPRGAVSADTPREARNRTSQKRVDFHLCIYFEPWIFILLLFIFFFKPGVRGKRAAGWRWGGPVTP